MCVGRAESQLFNESISYLSMILSKHHIAGISPDRGVLLPQEREFSLPEKVLQFGTGVLLRGLPDYFIDKANKLGVFNGRVVVVKSTSQGDGDAFVRQDGLYTLCVRGVEEGVLVEENRVIAAISRVLSATEQWDEVLACAANADLQIIVSNTTEIGIRLVEEAVRGEGLVPQSFPGKLLAFLEARYRAFEGAASGGMVILPTELISDNGTVLRNIVLELARFNGFDVAFLDWLLNSNHWCNSLVDRIVPGKLPAEKEREVQALLGYEDDLMIMSESYRLWAIETDNAAVRAVLSFSEVDAGVVLAPDIFRYKELKLRLLNAPHTFSCGLAYLSGFATVRSAMADDAMGGFVERVMMEEIVPAITGGSITPEEARVFAGRVLDRFRNPHMEHQWLSISVQYTSKIKARTLPILQQHYARFGKVPPAMAMGFAGYLLFMHAVEEREGKYYGVYNGEEYVIQDEQAAWFYRKWRQYDMAGVVHAILSDAAFWGVDLSRLPGFESVVIACLEHWKSEGRVWPERRIVHT